MPLITLSTNLALDRSQKNGIAKHLSVLTSEVIGKPEQWVMTHVSSQQSMTFAATDAPCAYLECKSIGLTDAQIPPLAAALCALLKQELQLDAPVFTSSSAQRNPGIGAGTAARSNSQSQDLRKTAPAAFNRLAVLSSNVFGVLPCWNTFA